jgi:hypothetical protein
MGTNIPGKKREPLIYFGGVPNYFASLEACENGEFSEFEQF